MIGSGVDVAFKDGRFSDWSEIGSFSVPIHLAIVMSDNFFSNPPKNY